MKAMARKEVMMLFFMLVFTAVIIYLTIVMFQNRPIGIAIERVQQTGQYQISNLDYFGQAYKSGVKPGSILLEVDGRSAEFDPIVEKYMIVEQAKSITSKLDQFAPVITLFYEGWGEGPEGKIPFLELYIPGAALLLFAGFSLFLYLKKRNDPAALLLILFFMATSLCYYSMTAFKLRDPIGVSVVSLVLPILPFFFLLFMNVYMKRFNVIFASKQLLIALGSIIAVGDLIVFLYSWTTIISREALLPIRQMQSGIILAGSIVCAVLFAVRFIEYRRTHLRSLFIIMFLSNCVAFTPFLMFSLIPYWLSIGQPLSYSYTGLFILVLPIVYFYLITSSQLFDIDFILTRFKYYAALSFIPATAITAATIIVLEQGEKADWFNWSVVFLCAYVSMIISLYIKDLLDQRCRPRLFKAMYSYQESLDRFSKRITGVMKKKDLQEVLKNEIEALIPVTRLQFLTVDTTEYYVSPIGNELEERITKHFLLNTIDSCPLGEIISLPYGIGLVIGRKNAKSEVLWAGAKLNRTKFNSEELRWLKMIAKYASIVFENLNLIEGLLEDLEGEVAKEQTAAPWVLRLLFCLSENERRKLAADLHDSALQDQLLWYRKLEALLMDYRMDQDLHHQLNDIKEGLLDVIHQIRETCNELRPPLLKEMGLSEAIESIIEHNQVRVNYEIAFTSKLIKEQIHEEEITAMYRIVQELLRNADKHSKASKVKMELDVRGGLIYFHYEDNGIGMEVIHMKETFQHMGVSGIKERVASLEGEITFQTEKGKGLQITILLPLMLIEKNNERGSLRDSYLIS